MTPENFLQNILNHVERHVDELLRKKPQFKMATIDSDYTSGRPQVIFDGETSTTINTYPYLSPYTPVANARVLLAYVGGTYVIIGKVK